VLTSMIDWAAGRHIGFSHLVSLGDMSDVDFGDLLDFLALDHATDSILLYVETITHARKFMSAARIAARAKPVIVVKSGRSAAGARAAATHTGALAGADLVYDAAFRRAGALRVTELRDLFDAAETLASGVRVTGDRLTILTNGGGAGVLATDALEALGGTLAPLSDRAREALNGALPATWSHANPVDIIGDAGPDRYAHALETLLRQNKQDAILVMNCPTGVADGLANAQAIIAGAKSASTAILTCWLGEQTARAARTQLSANRIPAYETPDESVRAFMQLVDYRRNQQTLRQTPAAGVVIGAEARAHVRAIIAAALDERRTMLTEPEAKAVLAAYGVATVPTETAATPAEAAARAADMTGPLALKILSRDISHKSDVGGVRLDLTRETIAPAAEEMLASVKAKAPNARIDGFTVQPMIERPHAVELIAGLSVDPTFGPVILFGHGGISVEVVADRAMALPPLNSVLAADLVARTRVAKLLAGYRDVPAADMEPIYRALIGLADLAANHPEIAGIDINPLLADEAGVIALDARVEVHAAGADAADARFAIRPYPAALAHTIETQDGEEFSLRPIRPDDEAAIIEMTRLSTAEDMRLRFHGPMRELNHALASRLTQIDYDREMALIAEDPALKAIVGVSRIAIDPDFQTAEFAVMVRSDLKGCGLGYQLMQAILAYARSRGVETVYGDILRENAAMLQMAKALNATLAPAPDDAHIIRAAIGLKA
jgi:acetyltransferase